MSAEVMLCKRFCFYLWLSVYLSICSQDFSASYELIFVKFSRRSSVCPFVRPSHRWISQKWCKLGSPNFHRRLPGRL